MIGPEFVAFVLFLVSFPVLVGIGAFLGPLIFAIVGKPKAVTWASASFRGAVGSLVGAWLTNYLRRQFPKELGVRLSELPGYYYSLLLGGIAGACVSTLLLVWKNRTPS